MELLFEFIKTIVLGVVEGITEWLPISSTGHMILVDEFLKLNMPDAFKEMFFVVIQLGAILAVILLYWNKIFPFKFKKGEFIRKDTFSMWFKIAVACIPSAIIGLLFEDVFDKLFYNPISVALALIIVGVLFIIIENRNAGKEFKVNSIAEITYKSATIIGLFQLLAAIFPGTSRSGATIIGAIMIGISRSVATEFTFFLAIPTMLGASLLKVFKFGFALSGLELLILGLGTLVAFLVSIISIKFLTGYIKKNDFKAFGWYRIVVGIIVLVYFGFKSIFL